MKIISADEVHAALSYPGLVDALQEAFAKDFNQPPRQVFLLDDADDNFDAFALLPAWNDKIIAVKAFTYFPSNTPPHDLRPPPWRAFGACRRHHMHLLAHRRGFGIGHTSAES